MSELHEALAWNLKKRREALAITQEELAELAGISSGYVAEIEIARKRPSLETISQLARALQTRPYRLIMTQKDRAEVAETAGIDQGYAVVGRLRAQLDREMLELSRSNEDRSAKGHVDGEGK